jgi:periplasmic protein
MKNRNLLTIAILAGMLTACGGSGSDDSNNPSDPNGEKPLRGPSPGLQYQHHVDPVDRDGSYGILDSNGNNPGGNNNGGNNNQGNNGNNNNGGNNGGNNNGGNNGGNNNNGGNTTPPSYNEIEFNGKNITLLPSGTQPGEGGIYKSDEGSYRKIVGNQYGNFLYGVIIDKTGGGARAFTREAKDGARTTNMPKTGTMSYAGAAIHYDVSRKTTLDGTAYLNADFANNKLNGEINVPGRTDPIRLSANIIGNRFNGASAEKVVTDGNFFGDGATEVGGIYGKDSATPDVKEYIGAFGVRMYQPPAGP